jgi:aryl-alcohol dehydrogenase-like predicted oxidoreductase/predicted kinase
MAPVRIGLGCMRLSTDAERDEAAALATLRAALSAGVVVLDTARAYGQDDADAGHNERLVSRAVVESGVDPARVRVVTKCGMRRPGGAFRPDGRAGAIAEDARRSREALGPLSIDVLLLHAVDPGVPLATSVRALSRAAEEGAARRIGLSNVTRGQLEEALRIAPISAVEVALGAFDDTAARGGLVRFCDEQGIEVLAHSPLGGPKRAPRLLADPVLAPLSAELGAAPAEIVLAYLLAVSPSVVPLPGARRPSTAASALSASRLTLDEPALARLDARFPALGALRRPAPRPRLVASREVVLIMGVSGAGKSREAASWASRGYERLNRDEAGGTLRGLARRLDERLSAGGERFVLDNTYLTRASRSEVIAIAARHGARTLCRFFDVPTPEAQINVVLRMLDRYGELLDPEAIAQRNRKDPGVIPPRVQFRMARELEPPAADEGFAEVEVVPFQRAPRPGKTASGALVALEAIAYDQGGAPVLRADAARALAAVPEGAPCLLLAWRPGADATYRGRAGELAAELSRRVGRPVEVGLCVHPAGPPVCWCRPPLPGLWLAFAERRGIDPRRSVLVGGGAAHAAMARALGLEDAPEHGRRRPRAGGASPFGATPPGAPARPRR